MEKTSLTKKEKLHYWFLFIFLPLFGLFMAGTGVYMLASPLYAFSLPLLLYVIITFGGLGLSIWAMSWLVKEYKYWIDKEKEAKKKENEG